MTEIKKVVIIGAGGVGFWLTIALMRDIAAGIQVEVWDDDDIGVTGNGHFRMPRTLVGAKKVDLLADFVSHKMGDRYITPIDKRLEPSYLRGRTETETLFVDCTDMKTSDREALLNMIRLANGKYLRVSYDGLGIVTVSPGVPFDVEGAPGGYQMMPDLDVSFIAGGIGARAVRKVLEENEFIEDQWNFPALQRGNQDDVHSINSVELPGSEGVSGEN